MKIGPDNSECLIYTFKEGLLSKVAHDLKLRVTRFEGEWDGEAISVGFDPTSIEVLCPMKDGRENRGALGAADFDKILENIEREILHPRRFPEIRFESTDIDEDDEDEGLEVHGKLTLHGRTGYLTCFVRRQDGFLVADVPLNQPDYGVKPFRAMMGTLKIKPVIHVQFTVPDLE